MWKGFREIFNYNTKQRNGLLVLISLGLGIQVFIYFNDVFIPAPSHEDTERYEAVINDWERKKDSLNRSAISISKISYFEFDPNTVELEELQSLGLDSQIARRLLKYRNSGGKFYHKEDLFKLYGIDSSWCKAVFPYVKIQKDEKASRTNYGDKSRKPDTFDLNTVSQAQLESYNIKEWQARRIINYREKVHPYETKDELYKVYGLDSGFVLQLMPYVVIESDADAGTNAKVLTVELNSADSAALVSLPGIGSTFAKRIMDYRSRLGGYYASEQLLEVYGMDKERFEKLLPYLIVDETLINRMDINTASFKELVNHPYLNYEQVKNIVRFREKVRPFRTNEELKQIELIDEALFSKIAKYLNPSPSQ